MQAGAEHTRDHCPGIREQRSPRVSPGSGSVRSLDVAIRFTVGLTPRANQAHSIADRSCQGGREALSCCKEDSCRRRVASTIRRRKEICVRPMLANHAGSHNSHASGSA